jgi:NAD(P)H-dependent flavin oxidoreductase YrpB (nitropropane dioxygenase family)
LLDGERVGLAPAAVSDVESFAAMRDCGAHVFVGKIGVGQMAHKANEGFDGLVCQATERGGSQFFPYYFRLKRH